jgi:hypothetical protein
MDRIYADTVRLLLDVMPDVFQSTDLAMKGGTAINLFLRDLPRLSVDIDVVYLPHRLAREAALAGITREIDEIRQRLTARGMAVRAVAPRGAPETKLLVDLGDVQIKVEVNTIFRGSVLPIASRPLAAQAAARFARELSAPLLAEDELYGSKLVAAMDRQHPRDLFDVMSLYQSGGITPAMLDCFVVYLAGHNRPVHEVLFPNRIEIRAEYENNFRGMTEADIPLPLLLETRERLLEELPRRLDQAQRAFLVGLSRGTPDWSLIPCAHACELPALRWKLENLARFARTRPDDFDAQVRELETRLASDCI